MAPDKEVDLLMVKRLAELLDVTEATVYRWNSEGTGPKRIQIGKRVYYRKADVIEWINSREVAQHD